MKTLLLDVGATYIKSAWYDDVEGVVGPKQVPFPSRASADTVTADLDEVWAALPTEINDPDVRVAICCQMAGYVPMSFEWDVKPVKWKEDGPFISCWDQRCRAYRKRSSDIAKAVGGGTTVPLGNWIAWKLLGDAADPGDVHPTLWCAVDEFPHNGPLRTTQNQTRLLNDPCGRVFTPIGDHAASVHGCELATDELNVNLGTGGQVSMIHHGTGEGPVLHQVRPGIDCELACVTHLPAGAWLYGWRGKVEGAVVRWAADAARRLRPFNLVVLSGSLAIELQKNIQDELCVPCRTVEWAALRGLARMVREWEERR